MSAAAPVAIAVDGAGRPWWRRARLWIVLAVVVVAGAVLVGTVSDRPGRPLDPASAHANGSKALARLLEHYGVAVDATSGLGTAADRGPGRAVLVAEPDAYSPAQLRRLAAGAGRLVLVRPGTRSAVALGSGIQPEPARRPNPSADCPDVGARAAGSVALPGDTIAYLAGAGGAQSCFGGALLTAPRLAVLGSAEMLRNDRLADRGVAALDVNAVTDSRRLTAVVWLLPGGDADGSGPASLWDLFPGGAYRAFWWLIAIGGLAVLWRARRLGGVVVEPLPVVVQAAEVVRGHGRLYARAGARDRAAAALRRAGVGRLAARLGLPRGTSPEQVAVALAPAVGRPPAELATLLAGPAPADDAELMRLASELDQVESAIGGATRGPATGE